jgi:hypothetical protein
MNAGGALKPPASESIVAEADFDRRDLFLHISED